jgi:hypothetical protein
MTPAVRSCGSKSHDGHVRKDVGCYLKWAYAARRAPSQTQPLSVSVSMSSREAHRPPYRYGSLRIDPVRFVQVAWGSQGLAAHSLTST